MATVEGYGAKHANAWDNVAVLVNGVSNIVKVGVSHYARVSVFGNSNGAGDIIVQYSQDGTNFYQVATKTLAGAGDFGFDLVCAGRFVRLKSSAAVTITATVACK